MTDPNSAPHANDMPSEKMAAYIGELLSASQALRERTLRPDDAGKLEQIADEMRQVITARGDYKLEEAPALALPGWQAPPSTPEATGSRTLVNAPRGIANRLTKNLLF